MSLSHERESLQVVLVKSTSSIRDLQFLSCNRDPVTLVCLVGWFCIVNGPKGLKNS